MEKGRRSGGSLPDYMVKNRNSSGCLIVRKKGGDSSSSRLNGCAPSDVGKGFDLREKRARLEFTESGSSDELLYPAPHNSEPGTRRFCNGLSNFKGKDYDKGREVKNTEEWMFSSERKRTRLDVFEFDEYDGNGMETPRKKQTNEGGGQMTRFFGPKVVGKTVKDDEYELKSVRRVTAERKTSSFLEKVACDRDGTRTPIDLLRGNHCFDEPIRLQGKNGVLKVMVNRKISGSSGGPPSFYDRSEKSVDKKSCKKEDLVQKNANSETKVTAKGKSLPRSMKSYGNSTISSSERVDRTDKVILSDKRIQVKKDVDSCTLSKKSMLTKKGIIADTDSESSDTSLRMRQKTEVNHFVPVKNKCAEENPSNTLIPANAKQGNIKRGTGTEKQKLRERIRQMLLDSGWSIEYRPRRNKDYLDAVYTNPSGTAYWSIIKAYEALRKQLHDDEEDSKSVDDDCQFTPLPDDLLNQLTRKTKKKMEREMKKKRKENMESENAGLISIRKNLNCVHEEESLDAGSQEEKLSSFIKSECKSTRKQRGPSSSNATSRVQLSSHQVLDDLKKPSTGCNSQQKRKSRKLGRCTLLARSSVGGTDSEINGLVPYTGKRTLLSWLIDSGTVQLSQKVLYMNRRRSKAMLEGWATRDGIHCGCCSKILSVSKFEIHAGSKLRLPYQHICLESGFSLLECQVDAWNQQLSVDKIGFTSVDVDSGDPNDDTCGLCGDGGDLMCCDGCPSTFHLSCLGFKMLPPGDWHCPNCSCKYCEISYEKLVRSTDSMVASILTCNLCGKKYHKSCAMEMDDPSVDSESISGFCGRKCSELFGHLQRLVGVKHEMEGGLSWSLIHRIDCDSDTYLLEHPQKVECNSKLAVALLVMDECFLPIVDRRSEVNIIHNVVYSCGSNFSRLNYSGFYAVILEKGDEIISAASIRFHGTRLAEMPFIGTRHVYRRQGMCRRLLNAIESILLSFKVERLVIPAISELKQTWTGVFGFTSPDKSLKQELKFINMLVFPGVDMLEKQFLEPDRKEDSSVSGTGYTITDFKETDSSDVTKQRVDHDRYEEKGDTENVYHKNTDTGGINVIQNVDVEKCSTADSECLENCPRGEPMICLADKSSVEGYELHEAENDLLENGKLIAEGSKGLKNVDGEGMPDVISDNKQLQIPYGISDNDRSNLGPSDKVEIKSHDIESVIHTEDRPHGSIPTSVKTSNPVFVAAGTEKKAEIHVSSVDISLFTEGNPNLVYYVDRSLDVAFHEVKLDNDSIRAEEK